MTANAITIEPHDTMERAAVVMRRERIGALPVVHRGELRGIVSRTDVLRAYLALASYDRKVKNRSRVERGIIRNLNGHGTPSKSEPMRG